MTDKQMAKKKKEFIEYLQGERVYLGKAGQEIDAYDYILRTEEEVWQWIEKLVEEVESEAYKKGLIDQSIRDVTK